MIRATMLLVALAGVPLAAAAQDATNAPVIVTTGHAEVKRAPDRAWVSINAESRAKDPKEAQRLNAAAMSAVIKQLEAMNLGAEAIRTTGYQLQPEYDFHDGRQTLRGYLARNSIEVRVDEIARVGDVLGAAVGSGATSVGGLRFGLHNQAEAEREALRRAVEDARGRAEAAAAGAGVQIVRVQRIEEQGTRGPEPPRPMMRQMAMESVAGDAPPITPGTIEISATVTLTVVVR